MASIQIDHLTFTYPLAGAAALREVCLDIPDGGLWLLCGPSGGGKTTLLRHLKTVLTPHGTRTGGVFIDGTPLDAISARDQARRIGFVLQQPEDQIVTDKVWHELAFGAENLGMDVETMRLRVGEMASFFGIQTWFDRETDKLSGGQKQMLNLASALVLQPDVLILDEPTAQLDPIAAAEFLRAAERVSHELGVTVLLSEQRLEQAFAIADGVAVLERGEVTAIGTPRDVARALHEANSPFFTALPSAARIWGGTGAAGPCPMDVREGRRLLRQNPPQPMDFPSPPRRDNPVLLELKDVWFRYEKNGADVLRGMSAAVRKHEIFAIVGGNGSGKSTALRLLGGRARPYRGRVIRHGVRIAALAQDPRTLFSRESVGKELSGCSAALLDTLALKPLLDRDPGDLSGGELQRAAIALLLAQKPDVLLLDEPTKGMDAVARRQLGALLRTLAADGLAVVLVSHDVSFCAEFADRAGLLFDGQLLAAGDARSFFTGNHFYTTAANRIARPWLPGALLCEEVIDACRNAEERSLPQD